MKRPSWGRGLQLAAGLGWLLWVAPAAAQEGRDTDAAQEAPESDRAEMRQNWLDERRQEADPALRETFRPSLARLNALSEQQTLGQAPDLPNTGSVWAPIGPAPSTGGQTPQDFAQPSPVSGRSTDLLIHPSGSPVYVGGAQGGVWRTTDSGATWTALTDALGSLATGSLALDPSNANTIYYGTGEGNFSADSYAGVGIFKSINGGNNWTGPFGAAQFGGRSVSSIAVDRTNSNIVLALSSSGVAGAGAVQVPGAPTRGVFRSTDAGATWTKMNNPAGVAVDVRGSIIMQDPITATRWYAAMAAIAAPNGGLWLSVDNGITWTSLNGVGGFPALAVPASGINRYWITGTFNVGDPQSTLYVATNDNNASTARGGRIYKSIDSGANWVQQTAAQDYCMGQCSYDMPIWVVPGNKNTIYHGGAGAVDTAGTTKSNFRVSINGGTSFVDRMRSADNTTALHSDVHGIMTDPTNANILWVANDGGVWRSVDAGVNWINRNTNLQLTQFTAFDVDLSSAVNRAYGGTQDNGTMGWTGGVAWPHLDFGDGGYAEIDQTTPNNLVHTYFNQTNNLIGVGCTTGGFAVTQGSYGGSFAGANGIALTDRVAFYAPIHLDNGSAAAAHTLYFGTNRIWRATNFFAANGCAGANPSIFVSLSGATDLLGGAGVFTSIETRANAVAGTNADVLIAGSSTGRLFRTINATAGAPTFTELDAGQLLFVSDILIDPTTAVVPGTSGTIYVTRSGFNAALPASKIRKSLDGGNTWSNSATGIPDIPINAIAFDPSVANRLWAGTDIGIYVSINAGASWALYGTGLPNAAVFDLKTSALPAGQGAILAVTHGRGAFRLAPLTPVNLLGFDVE